LDNRRTYAISDHRLVRNGVHVRLAASNIIDVPTLQGLIDGLTSPRRRRV